MPKGLRSWPQIHEAFSEVNKVEKRQKGGGWSLINRRSYTQSQTRACFPHMGCFPAGDSFAFIGCISLIPGGQLAPKLKLGLLNVCSLTDRAPLLVSRLPLSSNPTFLILRGIAVTRRKGSRRFHLIFFLFYPRWHYNPPKFWKKKGS